MHWPIFIYTHTRTRSLAFWQSAKTFFRRLLSSELSQGARDYYTAMLFFDILCFLTIVFGVNSFGVSVCGLCVWGGGGGGSECGCVFACVRKASQAGSCQLLFMYSTCRLLIVTMALCVDGSPLPLLHRLGFRMAHKLPWQSTFAPTPFPSHLSSCFFSSFCPC